MVVDVVAVMVVVDITMLALVVVAVAPVVDRGVCRRRLVVDVVAVIMVVDVAMVLPPRGRRHRSCTRMDVAACRGAVVDRWRGDVCPREKN
jgi:hypothetical protein